MAHETEQLDALNKRFSKASLKAILAGSLATLFEWYDYALYGYFAPIIASQFFPSDDPIASLLPTFAVFATGFAVRPLGAILFGYIGDRVGRKYALSLSVIMMAVPTALIGVLPTYNEIGNLAAVLLVIIRLIQGLAVGGNYGGSFVFAIEHAPKGRKGLAGSSLMVGTIAGILIGSAVATLFTNFLDEAALHLWGWRVPFIIGLTATLTGVYVRKKVPETPKFQEVLDEQEGSQAPKQLPIKDIWRYHKGRIFTAMCAILPDVVGIYIMFFFMTTYLTTVLGWKMGAALTVNTINLSLMTVLIPFFGWLSDRIGRPIILKTVAAAFVVCSIPVFLMLGMESFWLAFFAQFIFAIALGAYYGAMPVAIVEYFPVELRYTASALSFNVAAAFFGGTAPWIATWLVKTTKVNSAPAFYLTLVGVVTFAALLKIRRDKKRMS